MMKFFARFLMLALLGLAACSTTPTQAPFQPVETPPPAVQPNETPPQGETPEGIAGHGLSGRIVLIEFNQGGNKLLEINLESGETRTLFQAPENSWLADAVVSPDQQQIALTYAPPPPSGETQLGFSDLFLLPYAADAQPQPFLTRTAETEAFYYPAWTPDGQSIYYTHLHGSQSGSQEAGFQNDIEKASLQGETETILEHAMWPALSPDGASLSYLSARQDNPDNELHLADPDGANPKPVMPPGSVQPVDAHLYTADGSELIFSMVNLEPAPTSSWLEKLLGVGVASAHNVPSDWYRVSIAGGDPQRITTLDDLNLYGDLSPDGRQLAFAGASGLYVVDLNGSSLIQLASSVLYRSVNWVP